MFSLKAWMRLVAQVLNPAADKTDANALAIAALQAQAAPTGKFAQFALAAAPAGWVAGDGSTIGNVGSGAARANVDTLALFTAWWSAFTDAQLPMLTSAGAASTRGASAAADWAALKRMTVFDTRDYFIRNSGASRAPGTFQADQVIAHTHPITPVVALPATGGTSGFTYNQVNTGAPLGAGSTGSAGAGTETRPINFALLGCFKL